jgi:hypothetical protein
MSPILRNVLSIVAGVVVGVVVIALMQMLNAVLFPVPAGVSPTDPAAMATAVRGLPTGAFIGLILGYLLGTTAGCYTAVRIAVEGHRRVAWLVAFVFIIGGILNFRSIPHPAWVMLLSFAAFAVGPQLALLLAGRAKRA